METDPEMAGDRNGSHAHLPTAPPGQLCPHSPPKPRPWSSQGINQPVLSPSPTFVEDRRRASKDDIDIASPQTSKRPAHGRRGLSLQMPPRDTSSTSTANLSKRVPASPKPDSASAYPSPTSVLPRRSRGLDFSRAATNLHHTIVAEPASPESSPSVSARRSGIMTGRNAFGSFVDSSAIPISPRPMSSAMWANVPGNERGILSSSLGSSAICDNGSDSSSSDDSMDFGEDEDTIHMTPGGPPSLMNPFGTPSLDHGSETPLAVTPAAAKLLSYQRARLQSRRSRTRGSSGSASGQSSLQSPVPPSPPLVRTIESSLPVGGNYHLDEPAKKELDSRRQSLSLGTSDMRLSDVDLSADEGTTRISEFGSGPVPSLVNSSLEDRKQVVRRAVTRRGNLLPKSKGFARIKAALLEEGSPLDTELRREAEVIKQVRDGDEDGDLNLQRSHPTTTASSPSLAPTRSGPLDVIEGLPSDFSTSSDDSSRRQSSSAPFGQPIRPFWLKPDERVQTPPPLLLGANSSGNGDDLSMDAAQSVASSMTPQQNGVYRSVSQDSASSTPQTLMTTTFDLPRKGNKRMRDDDFDPVYFKRRAVSPSLSVQNSPVLPQSPGWWGASKRDERISSNGSSSSNTGVGKRIGMGQMNDTNDGLMNMSIE